jgi:hypothetical protein
MRYRDRDRDHNRMHMQGEVHTMRGDREEAPFARLFRDYAAGIMRGTNMAREDGDTKKAASVLKSAKMSAGRNTDGAKMGKSTQRAGLM